MAIEVDNWDDVTPDANILVSGTSIDEGMLPGLINNALRRIMAAVSAFRKKSYCLDKNVTFQASGGALPVGVQEGHLLIEY